MGPGVLPRWRSYAGAMRRLLALVLLAVLALAGCGSSSGSGATGAPLRAELSYFAPGSPFVLSLTTSPSARSVRSANALLGRFPLAGFAEQELFSRLQQVGIDYATDVKPLLGDPVTLGVDTANPTGLAAQDLLAVWRTTSARRLSALIHKIPGTQARGSADGAKLFSLGTLEMAQAGPTLLLSGTPGEVQTALARHAHRAGLTSAEDSRLATGLPAQPLLEAFGDLRAVLSTPQAAEARQVPWVAAIRGYGVALEPSGSGLRLAFRLDTGGARLSPSELPLADAAATSLFPGGGAPISVGISDPGQAVSFLLGVLRVAKPNVFSQYPKGAAAARDLAGLLHGDGAVASDTRTTLARLPVTDPARAKSDLAAAVGSSVRSLGGGFSRGDGVTIGSSGSELLVGRASVAQLKAFASVPSTSATGTEGDLVFRIVLPAVLALALHHAPSGAAAALLSQFGDLTGSVKASAAALSGVATLALK